MGDFLRNPEINDPKVFITTATKRAVLMFAYKCAEF